MPLEHGVCPMIIMLIIPEHSAPDDSYIDASGAWRGPNDGYINESGEWRQPGDQYIDYSGGWRY